MPRTPRVILIRCKAIVGKTCRNLIELRTRGGRDRAPRIYQAGMLWRVSATWRGRFDLVGIEPDGSDEMEGQCLARFIRRVDFDDISVTVEFAETTVIQP